MALVEKDILIMINVGGLQLLHNCCRVQVSAGIIWMCHDRFHVRLSVVCFFVHFIASLTILICLQFIVYMICIHCVSDNVHNCTFVNLSQKSIDFGNF